MNPRAASLAMLVVAAAAAGCGDGNGSAADRPTSTSTTTANATATGERGSAPPTTTTTRVDTIIEVRLTGGDVEGGPRRETVEVGSTVTIRVVADVAEELHVHTYDLSVELAPGDPGEVTFDATIPGRHEVEFERSGKVALTLEVR